MYTIRSAGRRKPEPPPRRAASTRGKSEEDKEDVFKKKLRSAVYDALSEKGINEKSQLFRSADDSTIVFSPRFHDNYSC